MPLKYTLLTQEQNDSVYDMLGQNLFDHEIASATNVSVKAVTYRRRLAGIPCTRRPFKWTLEILNELSQMILNHHTKQEVAAHFGLTVPTLDSQLSYFRHRKGIPIPYFRYNKPQEEDGQSTQLQTNRCAKDAS